jgi:hypothetical protein
VTLSCSVILTVNYNNYVQQKSTKKLLNGAYVMYTGLPPVKIATEEDLLSSQLRDTHKYKYYNINRWHRKYGIYLFYPWIPLIYGYIFV